MSSVSDWISLPFGVGRSAFGALVGDHTAVALIRFYLERVNKEIAAANEVYVEYFKDHNPRVAPMVLACSPV